MKKFTNIQETKVNTTDKNGKTELEEIVESCLKVEVDGEIDNFISKNIQIEGKDKLIDKISQYINKLKNENTEEILEKVRYQGLSFVEKQLLEKQI